MRVGVITTKEFQLGESMIRRQKSAEHLKKQADATRERFYKRIGYLAMLRMKLLIPWWHMKFPTRTLKVLFGMGTAAVWIDERHYTQRNWGAEYGYPASIEDGPFKMRVQLDNEVFEELDKALEDVDDITNGFSDGCPDDIIIKPIKQRTRRPHVWKGKK